MTGMLEAMPTRWSRGQTVFLAYCDYQKSKNKFRKYKNAMDLAPSAPTTLSSRSCTIYFGRCWAVGFGAVGFELFEEKARPRSILGTLKCLWLWI